MRSHARLGLLVAALSSIILACSSGGGSKDPGPSCKGLDAACTAASECCTGTTCQAGVCKPGVCKPLGAVCGSTLDCCSDACSGGVCVDGAGGCHKKGESCSVPSDCCTGQCASGLCIDPITCVNPGQTCAENKDCCTGACVSGTCGDSPTPSCMDKGASCSSDEQCCSLDCANGKCTSGDFCKAPNNSCDADGECCSLNCVGEGPGVHGTCDGNACVPAGSPALSADRCCSKVLSGGVCQKLGSEGTSYACTTLGESCSAGYECCSRNCQGGTCIPAYTCHAPGDICTRPEDCCSGMCSPGATAADPGRCVAPSGGCTQDGVPCDGPSTCCTRKCVDVGSGTTVCQPAGGCRMTGSFCDSTGACCGGTNEASPGTARSTYGVYCDGGAPGSGKNDIPPEFDTSSKNDRTCTNGTSCNPPGNICGAFGENASQNCCVPGDFNGSGKIVCKRDANDIPRCFGSPPGGGTGTNCPTGYDGSNPSCCIQEGAVCQFREQCCGGTPCVPDGAGVLRCATSTAPTCDPRGTQCNPSSANCCEGTTCKPAGDLGYFCTDAGGNNGQCVIQGGGCTSSGQCCSGTTCNAGICDWAVSCLPADATCTVNADCCSGLECNIAAGATSGLCKAPVSGPTCSQSGQACTVNTDCCNTSTEVCVEGVCAPPPPLCKGIAQACSASGECCSGLSCSTTSGNCEEPPPAQCAATGAACSSTNTLCCEASQGVACRQTSNPTLECTGTSCTCVNPSACIPAAAACAPGLNCCDSTMFCLDATPLSIKQCDSTTASCVCKKAISG